MSTNPELPGILATAAARVDRVGEQVTVLNIRLASAGASVLFGWSGVAHDRFGRGLLTLQKEANDAARRSASLAGTLRTASGNAAERIRREAEAAALALRQAEEARQRAAAAARAKGTK
jgi:hypothetical protein